MKALFFIISLALYQILSAESNQWTTIDPELVNDYQGILDALTFGARYVVNQGIQAGDLRDVNYYLDSIHNISEQVVYGAYYYFDVELSGDDGSIVRTRYIVYFSSWNNTSEVVLWLYQIENTQGNNEENTENEFQLFHEHGFLEEIFISNEDRQFITNEWTRIDPNQVNTNLDMQNALNLGVEQVTQQTIPDGKIGKINKIETQIMIGIYYRFDVDFIGEGETSARIIFVVYSQPLTGIQTLVSYIVVSQN